MTQQKQTRIKFKPEVEANLDQLKEHLGEFNLSTIINNLLLKAILESQKEQQDDLSKQE